MAIFKKLAANLSLTNSFLTIWTPLRILSISAEFIRESYKLLSSPIAFARSPIRLLDAFIELATFKHGEMVKSLSRLMFFPPPQLS